MFLNIFRNKPSKLFSPQLQNEHRLVGVSSEFRDSSDNIRSIAIPPWDESSSSVRDNADVSIAISSSSSSKSPRDPER